MEEKRGKFMKEEAASPTVALESVILTYNVDSHEKRELEMVLPNY